MPIKALIATLLLGSSTVALASPEIRDHRTPVQAPVQARFDARLDARLDARFGHRPLPMVQRVVLANDLSIRGRSVINVSAQRAFTKLELQADGRGKVSIEKVVVHFGNGASQVVNLGTKLTAKQPSLTIDLKGNSRYITRIDVIGATKNRSALDIVAL